MPLMTMMISATGAFLMLLGFLQMPVQTLTEMPVWRLLPQAQSHGDGIYLNEVAESTNAPLPHIRLTAAPTAGQALTLSRAQVFSLVREVSPELATTNWTGATQVRVSRKMRFLEEGEARQLLTAALQQDFVKDRGELELRFMRPWVKTSIPDELFTVNILDLPSAGVTPNFVARFELRSGTTLIGNWQVPVQARIWREVWVAGSALRRGQPLEQADVTKERRDVLTIRDALPAMTSTDAPMEVAENLPAGSALTVRSLRFRPVVQRGHVVEALIQEGSMTISVKAEVLEDGLPGQTVRARNLKSRREFRGKVQNEETIVVAL